MEVKIVSGGKSVLFSFLAYLILLGVTGMFREKMKLLFADDKNQQDVWVLHCLTRLHQQGYNQKEDSNWGHHQPSSYCVTTGNGITDIPESFQKIKNCINILSFDATKTALVQSSQDPAKKNPTVQKIDPSLDDHQ